MSPALQRPANKIINKKEDLWLTASSRVDVVINNLNLGDFIMSDCNRCDLYYGPFCTTLPSGRQAKYDYNCYKVKAARTDVGDFLYCEKDAYKFGPGSMYGTAGWYPGRGY